MISLEAHVGSEITDLRNRVASYSSEPLEKYPGVTRILSASKDMAGLDAWRTSVGDAEADRIINESIQIGNSLDEMFNESLRKDNFDPGAYSATPLALRLWRQLKPSLDYIVPVSVQTKVWSNRRRVMGYLDCLGYYKGTLSVIDCKNARREKTEQHLMDYFLQCTAYASCLDEMFGVFPEQIVVMVARRDFPLPQIIVRPTRDYLDTLDERIRKYYENRKDDPPAIDVNQPFH